MITVRVDSKEVEPTLRRMAAGLEPAKVDRLVDGVAWKTYRRVVEATPKRWFGALRRAWVMLKPALGVRVLVNLSKVMGYLEYGTPRSAPGAGFIVPTRARALYLPLTRNAAMGWSPDLVRGIDYVLRSKVRGIAPRGIVKEQTRLADRLFLEDARQYVRGLVR